MSSSSKQKLISPPVSPLGKTEKLSFTQNIIGISSSDATGTTTLTTSIPKSKHDPSIVSIEESGVRGSYKAEKFSKSGWISFIKSYTVRGAGHGKPAQSSYPSTLSRKSQRFISSSSSSSEDSRSSKSSSSEHREFHSTQSKPKDPFNDKSLKLVRPYATRSKKRIVEPEESTEFPGDKKKRKTGIKQDDVTNASPSHKYRDKLSFLNESSVQYVHNSFSEEIPDFAPSFDRVDTASIVNSLKRLGLSITGLPKDLEGFDNLHEEEIVIVTALRLTPMQYFDTKRRFFAERARKAYMNGTFKKTDAQKACKIDVNKTSKLFEVFKSCGFLDDKLCID